MEFLWFGISRARVLEGMKPGTLDRTKVVLRHLPPGISEAMLVEQVDTAFAGRYNWLSFRPGKARLVFLFFLSFFIINWTLIPSIFFFWFIVLLFFSYNLIAFSFV